VGSAVPSRVIAGRYVLEERIGKGSMGEVWLARHRALGSPVAIKLLRPRSAGNDWFCQRFRAEARILARVDSRHVVRVFDFGETDDGLHFIAMEYLDGEPLSARLRRQRTLPAPLIARLLTQAARGLGRAHALGIVHRDFKPDNMILVRDDDGDWCTKVIDFGIAEAPYPAPGAGSVPMVVGTPHYMAPEQTRGDSIGPEADQWALAVVVYECATGAMPFEGRDAATVFRAVRSGRYTSPSRRDPALPRALDDWMSTALHPDPCERFANMRACAEELMAVLGGGARLEPWTTSISRGTRGVPVAPVAALVGAVAAGAVLAAQLALRHAHHPVSTPSAETRPAPPLGPPAASALAASCAPPEIVEAASAPASVAASAPPEPRPAAARARSPLAAYRDDPY
jgi:serine/threonine-protein kinase